MLCTITAFTGCKTSEPVGMPAPMPDREARMVNSYLYYLDGAGGGTAKQNWVAGVADGFLAAGYKGAGEMFSWETGKGLIEDQDAPVKYKRQMAKKMTAEILAYEKTHPDAPVGILGFSAGTAEAIFALEDLPLDVKVDTVVLLGASISAHYDLTEALKRIAGKLYVFTSTHDKMLGVAMRFSGTADRERHDKGAGIHGFALPEGASTATSALYSDKIVTIPWNPQFEEDGDSGHHFDNIKMEFIRDHVAPIFVTRWADAVPARSPNPAPASPTVPVTPAPTPPSVPTPPVTPATPAPAPTPSAPVVPSIPPTPDLPPPPPELDVGF